MTFTPPPLPGTRTRRTAVLLNLGVPGAGQIYLGQYVLGWLILTLFLASFAGVVGLVINGFLAYLQLLSSDQILETGRLESVVKAFHFPWLIGLLTAGVILWIISLIGLAREDQRIRRTKQSR